MPFPSRLLAAGLAGLVLAAGTAVPSAAATPAYARTTAAEARRVDRVPTPVLHWYPCNSWAQCATAKVPLDYDHPSGRQTEIALLRVKARDQKHRIGSLFVNPGGPGAPATDFALLSPLFLSDPVLARFDIVGMDPRGIGASTGVNCFGTDREQSIALKGMETVFPYGRTEEAAYIRSARAFGKACSTTGAPLSGSMSTAEVARDMDVMRRAVGDRKLTYLGFSYGTAIGQYYANMFPDRFRALAIDGVINPVAWAGSKRTRNTIQDERLGSAAGAYRAFAEIMRRCDVAGPKRCDFAASDPMRRFQLITTRLKKKPVVLADPLFGTRLKMTYALFVANILSALYSPYAGEDVAMLSQDMWILTSPASRVTAAQVRHATTGVVTLEHRRRLARAFPYDNSFDAYAAVMCTDGRHPASAAKWPVMAAAADRRAPYFGRAWAWASAQCARNTWTVRDEDAWTGPFDRRTRKTVLVVGSTWDPATNYADAVKAAALLPNSRLLTSRNWGHTAYGTSACATGAIDTYLLRARMPRPGTVCVGDDQPFTGSPADLAAGSLATADVAATVARGLPPAGTPKQLPPVGRLF